MHNAARRLINDLPVDHFKEAQAHEEAGRSRLLRLGTSLNTNWFAWNLHPGSDPDTGESYVEPMKARWFNNLTFRTAMNHAIAIAMSPRPPRMPLFIIFASGA